MLQSCVGRCVAVLLRSLHQGSEAYRSCCLLALLKGHERPRITESLRNHAPRRFASEVVPLRKQLKDEAKKKRLSGSGFHPTQTKGTNSIDWELTVGIEIHAQLNTACKLFSGELAWTPVPKTSILTTIQEADTSFNALSNSKIEPFDISLPGTQPHLQLAALLPALRAAIALQCTIQPMSRFDRKHYFYHDQPAGYQITQYYEPFARNGQVTLTSDDGVAQSQTVEIKQIQMEQDTAKSQEQDEGTNLIDFNRAGLPLIEIISLPQIHSSEAAAAYVKKIQAILLSVDAVTTGMEHGGLRADVNVSVRRRDTPGGEYSYSGISGLGQRTEIKNLSTIKAVEDAVNAEASRQIAVLEAGGNVEGETRGWSLTRPNETRRLRGKAGEVDYSYMPDPDVPPLYVGQDLVEHLQSTLPALPDELLQLLTGEPYNLSLTDAKILLQADTGDRLDFYQETVEKLQSIQQNNSKLGKLVGNWVLQEIGHILTTKNITWEASRLQPSQLAVLLDQLLQKTMTGGSAKHILGLLIEGDQRPVEQILDEDDLRLLPLSDEEYVSLSQDVMAANPAVVEQIVQNGHMGKVMFLVGQMMRHGPEGRVEAKRAELSIRRLIDSMKG